MQQKWKLKNCQTFVKQNFAWDFFRPVFTSHVTENETSKYDASNLHESNSRAAFMPIVHSTDEVWMWKTSWRGNPRVCDPVRNLPFGTMNFMSNE